MTSDDFARLMAQYHRLTPSQQARVRAAAIRRARAARARLLAGVVRRLGASFAARSADPAGPRAGFV